MKSHVLILRRKGSLSYPLGFYSDTQSKKASHPARTVSGVNPDKSCVDGLHANLRRRPLQQVEPAFSILLSGLVPRSTTRMIES